MYKLKGTTILTGIKQVLKRLSKNPMIISILSGVVLSYIGFNVTSPISTFLHMLGRTTSTVAIFMLGIFFYGRKYKNLTKAYQLSLLRIIFLPLLAFIISNFLQLPDIERSILVLMHSMPVAISMMILSEHYAFNEETFSSLILIASLGAVVYLNIWLLLLGHY